MVLENPQKVGAVAIRLQSLQQKSRDPAYVAERPARVLVSQFDVVVGGSGHLATVRVRSGPPRP